MDTNNLAEALPEFDLNVEYEAPVAFKPQYPDFYEDISSVSSPEYYGESEQEAEIQEPIPEQTMILQDLSDAIFADDFDDTPIDFSYQPDFDSYFDVDITTD